MNRIEAVLSQIKNLDISVESPVRNRLDSLTKPQGSLGKLEDIALQYCLVTGKVSPSLPQKKIVVFAGDHGVVSENVSAYPKDVTSQMVWNMLNGGAAINVLARYAGIDVSVVDMGVDADFGCPSGLIDMKTGRGTKSIYSEPAMTEEEVVQALTSGLTLAEQDINDGYSLLGTGDMGIGNTTASSALFASLLPCSVEDITGLGSGIKKATLTHKIKVIKQALTVNAKHLDDPMSALAALGGFEIAGICGYIIGAVSKRTPVVIDGFISSAAALTACRMCSNIKEYLFFSHLSAEKGHRIFFEEFGVDPILDLNMRLGEGTGAALAMSIIEASMKLYTEMATFGSAGVSEKEM